MNCVFHTNINNVMFSVPYATLKMFQPGITHNLRHNSTLGLRLSSSTQFFRSTTCLYSSGSGDGNDKEITTHELNKIDASCDPKIHDENNKSHSTTEGFADELAGKEEPSQNATRTMQTARIHDFCFGIPYGGSMLCLGIIKFLISKDIAPLMTELLFGGSVLALSNLSLYAWRQGRSSTPFIIGQAVLAIALVRKSFQSSMSAGHMSLWKPVYAICSLVSFAMCVFYVYVMAAGGNPPPRNKKIATVRS